MAGQFTWELQETVWPSSTFYYTLPQSAMRSFFRGYNRLFLNLIFSINNAILDLIYVEPPWSFYNISPEHTTIFSEDVLVFTWNILIVRFIQHLFTSFQFRKLAQDLFTLQRTLLRLRPQLGEDLVATFGFLDVAVMELHLRFRLRTSQILLELSFEVNNVISVFTLLLI